MFYIQLLLQIGETNAVRAKIEIGNELKMTTISNVLGIIRGSVEPDRYVIGTQMNFIYTVY